MGLQGFSRDPRKRRFMVHIAGMLRLAFMDFLLKN